MIEKAMECFTNPVKSRLLLEIHTQGQTTAKRLTEIYSDIPQATLYRHLKKMTNDGILEVVKETQVRGTVERTYALSTSLNKNIQNLLTDNPGTVYMQMFLQYMMGFAKQFYRRCQSADLDIQSETSGFSVAPLYLTDQELLDLTAKISEVVSNAQNNKPSPTRKLRNIGIIISPEETVDGHS